LHSSIGDLLKVQDVDSQINYIRESLRLRPLELADDRRKLDDARRDEEAIAAQIKRLKMDIDRREVDVKKLDGDVEKLEVALNTARTNQEYTVIKEQIKRAQENRGKAEEEVIESLTELDNLESGRKDQAGRVAAEEKAFRRKEAEVEEVLKGLREQLAKLEASREALLPGIDKEHLKIYERVLARHTNFAIARVENQVCQGCYMSVTSQEVNLLLQGQFLQCKSCSRLLLLSD
jgi:predicted  nucleic acid-binding Zn-ribbon protein